MIIIDQLNEKGLNSEKLESGLKSLGLDFSKFENINLEQVPELVELFVLVEDINANITSKFVKIDLRLKLDKIIKGEKIEKQIIAFDTLTSTEGRKAINEKVQISISHSQQDIEPIDNNKKLGKVKFFDSTKGFGYVQSFDDKKDCFIHVSKLLVPIVYDDAVLIFKTVPSRRKPGESDAVEVSTLIPVFIFNKKGIETSFSVPLLNNHLEKEIALYEKEKTGFHLIEAKYRNEKWTTKTIYSEKIKKSESIYFGKKLIKIFLLKPYKFIRAIECLYNLLKTDIDEQELELIFSDFFDILEKKSLAEINDEINSLKIFSFIHKNLKNKRTYFNKISFVAWSNGELEKLPDPSNQYEVNTWRFEILPSIDLHLLPKLLSKLLIEKGANRQVEASYKYFITKGIDVNSDEELNNVILFLELFKSSFPSIILSEDNFRCSSSKFFIELNDKHFIKDLSENRIIEYITEIKSNDEKVKYIEGLPSNKVLETYEQFPLLVDYKEKYKFSVFEKELSKIEYLCFDLESDGQKINEFAWKSNLDLKSDSNFEQKEDGIIELVTLLNSKRLIIGQNIKEFDLPLLSELGLSTNMESIWDTLEIEMLLNPNRFSYGLKTQHNAISDTKLTYLLFKNQLLRILSSQSDLSSVKEFLPSEVLHFINQLDNNPIFAALNFEYFERQSNDFYRPNPTNQNISGETLKNLSEKFKQEGNIVVIAPEFIWNTLSHQFNISFYSDDNSLAFFLNKEKIENHLVNEKLLKAILIRFVDECNSKQVIPHFQHLSTAIKIKISNEQKFLICDKTDLGFGKELYNPLCFEPSDIEVLKQNVNRLQDLKVIVVGNELYNLTSKMQLGKDFDFVTIFDRLKNEPIWLQMAGGKGFISLEQKHCIMVGITVFPEFTQNIWLEKIGKGNFKIWCNINFDNSIKSLGISQERIYFEPWIDETISKINSFVVRPDGSKAGYFAEQKRVNPESLYRKMYWVYQFKLFESIGDGNNPKILILNDELEFENLTAYARNKGYFIPDTRASLFRQIELLHNNRSKNKLLITSFRKLDKVISSNYLGPIDFIWDSFLLQEKLQMLKQKDLGNLSIIQDHEECGIETANKDFQKDYDLFSLIRFHKPLLDYYYKMLYDNNHDSKLFLCDTRLTDFYGIEKSLNLNAKNVQMWYKEADYDNDTELATDYFPVVNENIATDFDIDEAKEVLRQIFLIPEEGGTPYEWHDYQHPCLNDILPAKKDLLISLPTGAGKSLLFQGPVLFRSAFSSKLSIVISPLRALMQDQVDALWNKGFYSNVEYLSGDKSHVEIKDIYRRVSGGEITLLYITPERFRSRTFENCLLTRLDADSGLEYIVFDEAHCISQWGQEFRPDYLNAARKVAGYSKSFNMRKLLFSATISEQVFEEVSILMPGITTVEGLDKTYNPVRDHIKMDFKHDIIEDHRLVEIANYLKGGNFNPQYSRAIVFVKSRRKVDECSILMPDSLKDVFGSDCSFSEKVGAFHAGMDSEDRKDTYEKYKSGEIVILFATKAFGMGMDIPNIHYVSHYSPPSTFEDFLQEIGRAGRNEKQRSQAGFSNKENPIKTLCLTSSNDFAKLKDQLHESRISWPEVKEIKSVLEKYISRFKLMIPDIETPVAVPFNIYSLEKGDTDDAIENKFRIGIHWLERLGRIKLGYFTITHLEFDAPSLNKLTQRLVDCPDKESIKLCESIIKLLPPNAESNEVVQISIASLRDASKLSFENLFKSLLKNHSAGIFQLIQNVVIEPTKIRADEINFYINHKNFEKKYPALKMIFSLAKKILGSVPLNDSKFFESEDLDDFIKEITHENLEHNNLPWYHGEKEKIQKREFEKYAKDFNLKRSKHAFTIIRLLGKTKHESKLEKVSYGEKKIRIKQSIFNGYHKKDEWVNKIGKIEKDCIKLLDYVAIQYFENNRKNFNWPDIISELKLEANVKYLSDMLFILSVLGYSKTGGLLPTGIEVYLTSIKDIDQTEIDSNDKQIFEEFVETQEIRELKLISLQILSDLNDDKKDAFIKGFFAARNKLELINHLQEEVEQDHQIFKAFRGDAIKFQENNRLNEEQRLIYFAEPDQNINVMAGPGSGKTHTLTLRVARLIHHYHVNAEEILVLAYNRAVVSELKDRLNNLFKDLGYGSLSKRIKILTFHGLTKRYCKEELNGLEFNEWEPKFLEILNKTPGAILNHLAPLKHILVDEFQDINETRMDTLNKLHDLTQAHLFIIGDPNQSIYGYDRMVMDPYHYYDDFDARFSPMKFLLKKNHRSYEGILNIAGEILNLSAENQHLIPESTKVPDDDFVNNYAEVIDRTKLKIDWWDQISILMQEKIGQHPYKQIAILFRTNNEVYRGFQKLKGLEIPNVRIRIQGNLPYEFTRIRECHAVILFLNSKLGEKIPTDFKEIFVAEVNRIISQNLNWNHFYIRIVHSLVLEYLEENDELQLFDNLLEFIDELTFKDDGQLYKIYEKHLSETTTASFETEIVLTTMHKVKGLEFDCVVIAPSLSDLAINQFNPLNEKQTMDVINEEKRLAFVAYTRARYRLTVFNFERELALKKSIAYRLPEVYNSMLGIAVQPEIKKINIGWASKKYNFDSGVCKYISQNVNSGDLIYIQKRVIPNGSNPFTVHEIFKEGHNRPIGELSRDAGKLLKHDIIKGLIVNEVVVWTYEDTLKFDSENPGKNYSSNWCDGAKNQGYIYLVDFAGFGVPRSN